MNSNKLTYFAICAMAALVSCSQDEPVTGPQPAAPKQIYFRSYLPTVTQSRAQELTIANFSTCQVTAFNIDDTGLIDTETGEMRPYFLDTPFTKGDDGRFLPAAGNGCFWPDNESRLHFFAYYPSAESCRETAGDGYFDLVNASTITGGNPVFDFRLCRFKVATDIADEVDFISAYAAGQLPEDGDAGVSLDFKHRLARVEIAAWGANDKYDFEIAGVRIGNPLVQGDFNFASTISAAADPWENTSGHHGVVQHIFTAGDTPVILSKEAGLHASETDAASIMGSAGAAMVIPMDRRIEMWQGKDDPAIATTPYSTDRMYFSVLLRVSNKDHNIVFPYPNAAAGTNIVYLTVGNDGKITGRIYKINGEYYTGADQDQAERYIPSESEEIHAYAWAALPVAAKWTAGKIYTYSLNYSTGIGWHDPADPEPGEPIIERGSIPFNVSVSEWAPASDYNPDINVPKR